MTVRIVYGIESQDREYITPPTIGQIKSDPVLRAVLGHGDNVRALVHGVEQPDTAIAPDVSMGEVLLETKANSKQKPKGDFLIATMPL